MSNSSSTNPSDPSHRAGSTNNAGSTGATGAARPQRGSRRVIDNPDRVQAGVTRSVRDSDVVWSALTSGGGRIVRTSGASSQVLATVGRDATRVATALQQIDRAPAVFLHSLGATMRGKPVDLPRLVRDLLAGRGLPLTAGVELGSCRAAKTLSQLRELLVNVKPGAAQAISDVVTTSLDPFGPCLVPATVGYYAADGDHHAVNVDVDLTMALAALGDGDVVDMVDNLTEEGSASLYGVAIDALSCWDAEFAEHMRDADRETVEVLARPETTAALTATLRREYPGAQI